MATNTVTISELQSLSGPQFVLAASRLAQAISFLIVLGFSGGYFFGLGTLMEYMGTMKWVAWLPSPLIVLALFAVLRPSFWKQWINFAADSRGVYLAQVQRSEFVRVPWDRVRKISIGHFAFGGTRGSGSKGLMVEVALEEDEQQLLVPGNLADLLRTEDGNFRIGIANNLRSTKKSLKRVTALQRLYRK